MNETSSIDSLDISPEAPLDQRRIAKSTLARFLPVFTLATAVTVTILFVHSNAEMTLYRSEERYTVDIQAINIDSDIRHVSSDLVSLANQNEIRNFWDNNGVLLPGVLTALAREYCDISEYRQLYDQVRLIDEHGMEIVRVNFNDGHPSVVSQEELQNKQDRYYFNDTFELARGEVYVSPLDLNVEQGEIEQPLKPMIRFATPVFGPRGERRGIVVLNYFGAKLLERFSTQGDTPRGGQAMLLNANGYWLHGANPEDEWSFMYENRGDRTFAAAFPEAWERIRSERSCQFETPQGLFTSKTVYPLLEGQKSTTGSGKAFAPSQAQIEARDYYWKVVSFVPSNILYAVRNNRRMVAVSILSILSLVMFIGAWRMAVDSTLRRQAQQTRYECEERFRTIYENAPVLIDAFNVNGRCVLWNKQCYETFGWTIDEINAHDDVLSLFYPDPVVRNEVMRTVTSEPDGCFREWHPVTKDGKTLTTIWANFRLPDGMVFNLGHDITERKQAENALRDSEKRLKALSEASFESIFISEKGVCLDQNKTAERMFGYTLDEAIGKHGMEWIVPEDRERVNKNMQSGREEPYEITALRKDGTTFPAEIQARMIEYKDRTVRMTALRDIIKHPRLEQSYLTFFHNMLNGFALHEIIYDAQDQPIDYCFLAVNPAFERITGLKANDIVGKTVLEVLPGTEKYWIETYGRVVLTGESVMFENYSKELDKQFNVTAFRPVPNLFACIFVDISERKEAEEASRQSEARFRSLFETSIVGIYTTTPGGEILAANPALVEMLGYASLEELLERNLQEEGFEPSYPRSHFKETIEQEGEVIGLDSEWICADGRTIYVRENARAIRNDAGQVIRYEGTVENITDRKQAEEALRVSEVRLRTLFSKSPDTNLILIDGVYVDCNESCMEMLRATRDQIIGKSPSFFSPERQPDGRLSVEAVQEKICEIKETGSSKFEWVHRRMDGTEFWAEVVTTSVIIDGKDAIFGIWRDITDRKQAEEALRQSEARYRSIFETSIMGIYTTTPSGEILVANPAMVEILGFASLEELLERNLEEEGFEPSYPRSRFKETIEREGEVIGLESECDRADGRTIYVRENARAILNDAGEVIRYEGTVENITERMKAEKTLRMYEFIVESTTDHMSFVDSGFVYRAVNDAYLSAHGKTREEIVGHMVSELMGDDQFERLVKPNFVRCLSGEQVTYQAWFEFHELGRRYMDVAYHPYLEFDGSISGIIVSSHDFTTLQQAQDALAQKTMMLDNILRSANDIAIATADLELRITYYNPMAEKLFGFTAAEVVGKTVMEIHTKEKVAPERFNSAIETVHREGQYCYSLMQETEQGTRHLDSRVAGIFDSDGQLTGFSLFTRDVTERKQMEETLAEENSIRTVLIETLPYPSMLIRRDRTIVFANKVAREMGAVVGGQCWRDFGQSKYIPDEDKGYIDRHHEKPPCGIHCTFCLADNVLEDSKTAIAPEIHIFDRIWEIYWIPINEDLFLHYTLDITERKQAEEALRKSEERHRSMINDVLDSSEVGIFILDCEFKVVWINHALERYFGLRREAVVGKDKKQLIRKYIKGIFSTPDNFAERIFATYGNNTYIENFECHVLPGDEREERWLEHWSQPIRSGLYAGGRIEHYSDITKRKRAEKALQDRERYLSGLNDAAQVLLGLTGAVPFQAFVDQLGPVAGASRVYVFLNHQGPDGQLLMSQKAEWCAEGINLQIDNPQLQDLPYDVYFPRYQDTLAQGDHISGLVSDFPDKYQEFFEPLDVLAIMIIPILVDNDFVGFIGFDNCLSESEWDEVAQDFLRAASRDLAQAIKRVRSVEQVKASLKEKVVLLREIHHRVKNNMQVIVSLLRMHARRSRSERMQSIFEDCRDRINAMSLIHEALYQSENLSRIDFKAYLQKLCRNLSQAHGASDKGITTTVKKCNVSLDMDQGVAIGMVICELISNAFKHAFPLGKGGKVLVSLQGLEEDEVELIVQDDGKGLPPDIDIHNLSSLGLDLVTAAVTGELGGRIEVERDGGTRFIIRFKCKSA